MHIHISIYMYIHIYIPIKHALMNPIMNPKKPVVIYRGTQRNSKAPRPRVWQLPPNASMRDEKCSSRVAHKNNLEEKHIFSIKSVLKNIMNHDI